MRKISDNVRFYEYTPCFAIIDGVGRIVHIVDTDYNGGLLFISPVDSPLLFNSIDDCESFELVQEIKWPDEKK